MRNVYNYELFTRELSKLIILSTLPLRPPPSYFFYACVVACDKSSLHDASPCPILTVINFLLRSTFIWSRRCYSPFLYNHPLSRTIEISLRELAGERYLALRQKTNFAVDRRCVACATLRSRRLGGKKVDSISRTVINSQSPRFLLIIFIERRDFPCAEITVVSTYIFLTLSRR